MGFVAPKPLIFLIKARTYVMCSIVCGAVPAQKYSAFIYHGALAHSAINELAWVLPNNPAHEQRQHCSSSHSFSLRSAGRLTQFLRRPQPHPRAITLRLRRPRRLRTRNAVLRRLRRKRCSQRATLRLFLRSLIKLRQQIWSRSRSITVSSLKPPFPPLLPAYACCASDPFHFPESHFPSNRAREKFVFMLQQERTPCSNDFF